MDKIQTEVNQIKEHYDKQENFTIDSRKASKTFKIKTVNNAIKRRLLRTNIVQDDTVMDLGCGKGGDIQKYGECGISELYGIDISNISILNAVDRIRNGNFKYKATFKTFDCYGSDFDIGRRFNNIVIQFSFHYAFVDKKVFETALGNIDRHLTEESGILIMTIPSASEILKRKKEGNISNEFYAIEFLQSPNSSVFGQKYKFTLQDAINDCEEYLVDSETLFEGMKKYNLYSKEFESFKDYCQKDPGLRNTYDDLSPEEKEVVDLYDVHVFHRVHKFKG